MREVVPPQEEHVNYWPNAKSLASKHTYKSHYIDSKHYNKNIYVYTRTYMHTITTHEKRVHEFQGEWGGLYGGGV